MTRDELERRLAERIADGFCQIGEAPIEIFEEAAAAKARVTCTFTAARVGLTFQLDKVGFPFLRRQKSVDWLVLVHLPEGLVDAHIIECKTTMGVSTWLDVKDQMSSSVMRTLALAGVLEAQIRRFYCYTAFRNDRLSVRRSPDPLLMRQPLGSGVEPTETRPARAGQLDWEADRSTSKELACPSRIDACRSISSRAPASSNCSQAESSPTTPTTLEGPPYAEHALLVMSFKR